MNTGSFRFAIGEFECVSVSDGAPNYPPESFFSNTSLERVEEALRERNLPTAQVMTPYTCLFVDTGEHRVLIDAGATWEHMLPRCSRASIIQPRLRDCYSRT